MDSMEKSLISKLDLTLVPPTFRTQIFYISMVDLVGIDVHMSNITIMKILT